MTRMRPLTFNVNPQLEEDKHIYFSAADDQAKLMCITASVGRVGMNEFM
jgi:hypothetical protein